MRRNFIDLDNTNLLHYIEQQRCLGCGNKVLDKEIIMLHGGDENKCYHCNVEEGKIK
jgi:hypothetical protein